MLSALIAMYKTTHFILHSATIHTNLGVKQGSPSSCILFTFLINEFVKLLKERCCEDGFLKWLHCLILMDDTVILSTSRERCEQKLGILNTFCDMSGTIINAKKTKFFVINGNEYDGQPIMCGNNRIDLCKEYVYLGSVFAADGSIKSSITSHAKAKSCHFMKFVSFIRNNPDVPFPVKQLVLDAALISSLMYGVEGWLTKDLRCIESVYMNCIKTLLGVRQTTCNDVCLIEAHYPSFKEFVMHRQQRFFSNMKESRANMTDDPFMFCLNLAQETNTRAGRYITSLLKYPNDYFTVENSIKRLNVNIRIKARDSYKREVYIRMNPQLKCHPVYKATNIDDYKRIQFTRLRMSSHNLMVEKGRWSRIPRESRKCPCGGVQTEQHVIEECNLASDIKAKYALIYKIDDLFSCDLYDTVNFCFELCNMYSRM